VRDTPEQARFETLVLPHLAANNPARWFLRGGADAEHAARQARTALALEAARFARGDRRD